MLVTLPLVYDTHPSRRSRPKSFCLLSVGVSKGTRAYHFTQMGELHLGGIGATHPSHPQFVISFHTFLCPYITRLPDLAKKNALLGTTTVNKIIAWDILMLKKSFSETEL